MLADTIISDTYTCLYNILERFWFSLQVVFEAQVRDGPNAAVAIDDISFIGCDLSNNPTLPEGTTIPPPTTLEPCPNLDDFKCGDGQCVGQEQVCDFVTDCVNQMDELYCGKGQRSNVNISYVEL